MILSGSIHKADLATLSRCATERAEAFERSKATVLAVNNTEAALGFELEADRFQALAQKLATAFCERPVFLSQDDLQRAAEALEPLHLKLRRSLDRKRFREVDALRDQLTHLAGSLEPEEY